MTAPLFSVSMIRPFFKPARTVNREYPFYSIALAPEFGDGNHSDPSSLFEEARDYLQSQLGSYLEYCSKLRMVTPVPHGHPLTMTSFRMLIPFYLVSTSTPRRNTILAVCSSPTCTQCPTAAVPGQLTGQSVTTGLTTVKSTLSRVSTNTHSTKLPLTPVPLAKFPPPSLPPSDVLSENNARPSTGTTPGVHLSRTTTTAPTDMDST